ncbi:hypothetical protein B0H21DRAFT_742247 [Amylocystis lapponica]|nr:hypothetical protein B0H21DRAFT_742247 [Amylocystis lapponica]
MAPPSPLFPRPYLAGNISGITLQVEATEDQQSESLTFYKSRTRSVSVGRKSTQAGPRTSDGAHEGDRALFKCPVVSRKHAKITFTEYGNAYIIDLNSHHGTHILRPGDTVSRTIEPEVPTVLADGDMVTFGKTVGRDATLVRPVTACIKLIFGADPTSMNASSSPLATPESEKPSQSSSGRYGVHPSSESSSDDGSDMEEESRSPSPVPGTMPAAQVPESFVASRSSGKLELLRRLLPPMQASFLWAPLMRSASPDRDQTASPEKEHDVAPENTEEQHSEGDSESPVSSPDAYIVPPPPEPLVVGAFPSFSFLPPQMSEIHFHAPQVENDIGSESPEDVGAWNFDVEVFPTPESCGSDNGSDGSAGAASHEAIAASIRAPSEGGDDAVNDSGAQELSFPKLLDFTWHLSDPTDDCVGTPQSSPSPMPMRDESRSVEPEVQNACSLAIVEGQIEDVQNDIILLRLARRSNEVRFEEHVEETKNRLAVLDQQMLDVSARDTTTSERFDEVHGEVGQLWTHLKVAEATRELEQRGTVQGIRDCQDVLEEVKAVRDDVAQQIARGLEALQAARDEIKAQAAAAIISANARSETAPQTTATSLKRKRTEDEESEQDAVTSESDRVPECAATSAPKRRKTMRVMARVAQTATYATIGAVAAWTALAFA